jgi:hypothetical protein
VPELKDLRPSNEHLRKQAWDYFQIHATQRLSVFNFYIVISSVMLTAYFASFKIDSNLQQARPAIAGLICLFSFVFWKLDQRTKFLIKVAERALVSFEVGDAAPPSAKVFSQELDRPAYASKWLRLCFWRWHMSYSDCFNLVFLTFFLLGVFGLVQSAAVH